MPIFDVGAMEGSAMTSSIKVQTITTRTTNGSLAYTGFGGTPKALIFFATKQTAAGFGTPSSVSMGFATDSSHQQQITISADDAAGTTNTGGRLTAACFNILTNGTPTLGVEATLTSMDADGFTLNYTSTDGSAYLIRVIALMGADYTATVGSFNFPIGTGNASTSGVGLGGKPECVLLLSQDSPLATAQAQGRLIFGAFNSKGQQATANIFNRDNQVGTSDVSSIERTDACMYQGFSVAGTERLVTFTSMDADGWTLNHNPVTGSANAVVYLAIKGGTSYIGADTQKTSAGNQSKTGFGFAPDGVLTVSVNKVATTTRDDTQLKFSIGAADGTNYATTFAQGVDSTTPSVEKNGGVSTVAIRMATQPSTVNAEATLVSFDSDGYTLNWTTADATAREFIVIGFGPTTVNAGGTIRQFLRKLNYRPFMYV
jgi:hypothetical protein